MRGMYKKRPLHTLYTRSVSSHNDMPSDMKFQREQGSFMVKIPVTQLDSDGANRSPRHMLASRGVKPVSRLLIELNFVIN